MPLIRQAKYDKLSDANDMNTVKKEIFTYSIIAITALTLMAYSVHMLVGGLVEKNTEYLLMGVVVGLGIVAISYMVWDVVKRRRPT